MRRASCIIFTTFLTLALGGCYVYQVVTVTPTASSSPSPATSIPVMTNTPVVVMTNTAAPTADPTASVTATLTPDEPTPTREEIGLPLNPNAWLRGPVTHLPYNDSPPRNMDVPAGFVFEWRDGGFVPYGYLKDDPTETGDSFVRWDWAWISGTWCYGQDGIILDSGQRYLLRVVYNAELVRASGDFATSDVRWFASLNNASGGTTVQTYAQDIAGATMNGAEVLWVIESDRLAPMLQYRVCLTANWAGFSKAIVEWDDVEIRAVPADYGDVVVKW